MNEITYKLTGLTELSAKIQEIETNTIKTAARAGVKAGAEVMERAAKENADRIDDPETPNRIADNITTITRWQGKDGTMTGSVGVIGGAVYKRGQKQADPSSTTYFRYVEFGTRYAAAQPFLRPAMAENGAQILQAVVNKMHQTIDKKITMLPKK